MSRYYQNITWDDVPHLTTQQKKDLENSYPPWERDARVKGTPSRGMGAVYQVGLEELLVDDFEMPTHWPKAYALDVGWRRTAAIWGALDRDSDVLYLYSEHYRGQAEPAVHAEGIRARGEWIEGVIDPSARGRSQIDGSKLTDKYRDLGLNLGMAKNAVETGLMTVWQRMASGRLKVLKSLTAWQREYNLYRRDEKGSIVKEDDHLMDAMRYLVMSCPEIFKLKPAPAQRPTAPRSASGDQRASWMRR